MAWSSVGCRQYYAGGAGSGRLAAIHMLVCMKKWFWVLDAAIVVSFAVIGRDTHGFNSDWGEVVRISIPFLVALGVGIVVMRAWQTPTNLMVGLALGIITLAGGMLMRGIVFDDGTATTFILVSAGWIIGLMVAWRIVFLVLTRLGRLRWLTRGRRGSRELSGGYIVTVCHASSIADHAVVGHFSTAEAGDPPNIETISDLEVCFRIVTRLFGAGFIHRAPSPILLGDIW